MNEVVCQLQYLGMLYKAIEEQIMNNSRHDPANEPNKLSVEQIIAQYQAILTCNYEKKENNLVEELLKRTKQLKKELVIYKREVSQQNIDRLITDRRRQKEKERQMLESRWRQCNQSYKSMQEEQKRLTNEHKENLFDVQNLQNKIKDFQEQLDKLKEKYSSMEEYNGTSFVTQTKERSPQIKQKAFAKTGADFRKINQIYNTIKMKENEHMRERTRQDKQNITKLKPFFNSGNLIDETTKTNDSYLKKVKDLNKNMSSTLRGFTHTFESNNQNNAQNQLLNFLMNSRIKRKMFQILQREL